MRISLSLCVELDAICACSKLLPLNEVAPKIKRWGIINILNKLYDLKSSIRIELDPVTRAAILIFPYLLARRPKKTVPMTPPMTAMAYITLVS